MKIKLYYRKRNFSPVAMADIAFLLLIFLILTTNVNNNGNIKLPFFKYSQKVSYPEKIVVAVKENGSIMVDNKPSGLQSLSSFLDSLPDKKNTIVRLIADRSTDYSNVDKVLSLLKDKDVLKIVLVTEEPVNGKTR
ncbi:MAG: hypothetical protein GXP33_01225 [Spirochaetes bacterium]|nr:hypothetical protein [Spirochaetota bacterium]